MQFEHATANDEKWRNSPFYQAHRKGLTQMRRRLSGPEARADFVVLEELQAEGFTDYLLTATQFRIAEAEHFAGGNTGIMASWSTRRESGFSDADFEALRRIQRVFAVACHASIQKRVMANLANAYLGPTAGSRVLKGDIRRGDGERIPAVLWFSDLRGSTRLSERMDPDAYLGVLNRYYECTAAPVIEHGGEILNFIGDGVFAIFPVDSECPTAAAGRAERAAREALRRCDDAQDCILPDGERLSFGIGLSIGEVMFGNIGVPSRLAFSGIGKGVNAVQRIEAATKGLGVRLLADAAFTGAAPGAWRSMGLTGLRDLDTRVELFTLDREPSRGAEAPTETSAQPGEWAAPALPAAAAGRAAE
jgi:adenylate cyclase